jgi:uncharacterized protein
MRVQRITVFVAGVIAVGLVAAGCGGKRPTESADSGGCSAAEGRVSIATGNTGGVYYTLGGGLAQLISDNTPIKANAAETGASVQNIQQLAAGDYDIAFSLADAAADAVEGSDSFEGKKQDITALARIYTNYTQVVVRADRGISTVADMKGKKISTGSPKSGTEVIANRLLEAAGLDPAKDVSAQRLELTQTVDQMKTGQIDGFVWSGGLPTPDVTDLTTSMKDDVKFIDITDLLPKLQEINPVYEEGTLPADTYGLASDVPSVVVPNLLLVRSDFPEGDACAITKLVFDKKGELEKVHPAAGELDRNVAVETDPVPLHPGAKRALDAG